MPRVAPRIPGERVPVLKPDGTMSLAWWRFFAALDDAALYRVPRIAAQAAANAAATAPPGPIQGDKYQT